jgi:catechol 2,3-dioxygenase-like lactoylglutathione lyase family enzyme
MQPAFIEHVNLTVSRPERSAGLFRDLFGWRVRWRGPARDGGQVIHVGDEANYFLDWDGIEFEIVSYE